MTSPGLRQSSLGVGNTTNTRASTRSTWRDAWLTRRRLRRSGVSLVEVVVSTLLIGLLMTAALTSVGAAARTTSSAADSSDAASLARQLLDEITMLPYEDPSQPPSFGLESGESSGASGARLACDDLDDFQNWDDSPPKDRAGTPLTGYSGWQRSADVQQVNPNGHAVLSDNVRDMGLRLVTVTVTTPTGRTTSLAAYRAKTGGSLQSQGVGQTLVTWAGVSLQSGAGTPVVGGVSLINHAADQ